MPVAKTFQQLPKLGTPESTYDKEVLQNNAKIIHSLGVTLPKNSLKFNKTSGEVIHTVDGNYSIGQVDSDNVLWKGLGSKVVSAVSLDGVVWQIDGVVFEESVSIAATSRCTFMNCRFNKAVNVASGGRATFLNCSFEGTSSCINAGGPANVGIFGQKTSTVAHVNVTIIFEA